MRTCAQLIKLTLAEERYLLAFAGVLFDKLNLVVLTLGGHHFNSLIGIKLISLKGNSLLDDFFHLAFKLLKNLRRERNIDIKVIVEAVVNSRTYGELCLRIETLHSLSEDMRGGMPESTLAFIVVKGQYLQLAVVVNGGAEIFNLAVNAAYASGLVETHTETFGDLCGGNAGLEFFAFSAAQFNFDHKNFSFRC